MKDNRRRVIETSMESKSVNLKSAGPLGKKEIEIYYTLSVEPRAMFSCHIGIGLSYSTNSSPEHEQISSAV